MKSCIRCTFTNAIDAVRCSMCELDFGTDVVTLVPENTLNASSQKGGPTVEHAASPKGITCKGCTFLNHYDMAECEICQSSLRPSMQPSMQPFFGPELSLANIPLQLTMSPNELNFPNSSSSSSCKHDTIVSESSSFSSAASTEGILTQIRGKMLSSIRLCSDLPHITQKGFEGSHWTCAYRNTQMLCCALKKHSEYQTALFNGAVEVPDVYGLQSWIEKAWMQGYDSIGGSQLGYSLLGTTKWIGPTEVWSLLRSFGVKAEVVEFTPSSANKSNKSLMNSRMTASSSSSTGPEGSAGLTDSRGNSDYHSKKRKFGTSEENVSDVALALGEWVVRYFDSHHRSSPISESHDTGQRVFSVFEKDVNRGKAAKLIPPVYLQHEGHSRTIVGYERSNEGLSLLVFDPMESGENLKRDLEAGGNRWKRRVKRGLHTFRHSAYQALFIQPGIISKSDSDFTKVIRPVSRNAVINQFNSCVGMSG